MGMDIGRPAAPAMPLRLLRRLGPDRMLAAVIFAILVLRSESKIREPTVWVEDAIYLTEANQEGLTSIFEPQNTFLHVASRLISLLVSRLTWVQYPATTIMISIVVATIVCLQVRRLLGGPWGVLAALSMVLVPSDPEVFGLPSYIFWWLGVYLLALVVALADHVDGRNPLGLAVLVVAAATSGPFVLTATVVLGLRFLLRQRVDRWSRRLGWIAGACGAGSVAQTVVALSGEPETNAALGLGEAAHWIHRLLGSYWAGVRHPERVELLAWLTIAVIGAVAARHRRVPVQVLALAALFCATAVQSALRVEPAILSPVDVAPRYFFVPYVLFGWIVARCIASLEPRTSLLAATSLIVVLALNVAPVRDRAVVAQHWASHMASCESFPQVRIPVAFDGTMPWVSGGRIELLTLTRDECTAPVLDRLWRPTVRQVAHTFAEPTETPRHLIVCESKILESSGFKRSAITDPPLSGLVEITSRDSLEPGPVLRLRLDKGETLMFRAGGGPSQATMLVGDPAENFSVLPTAAGIWVGLPFTNETLPEEVVLEITDRSRKPDAWSSIAARPDC